MHRASLDGIRFNLFLDMKPFSHVQTADLVTIMGNAVDNAIEAARGLPKEQRIVYIRSSRFANMEVLQFSNRFAGELRQEEGRLSTTKADAQSHGIGLSSIEHAARRCGGSVSTQIDHGEKRFTLLVMIPGAAA